MEMFKIGPDVVDETNPAIQAERQRHFAPNIWPENLPALRPVLTEYMHFTREVADRLTGLFGVALGIGKGWFHKHTTHSTDVLNINHFQTSPGNNDSRPDLPGLGAHTDYGECILVIFPCRYLWQFFA
jgi:isopenicillin N synthase-like dioxygenase